MVLRVPSAACEEPLSLTLSHEGEGTPRRVIGVPIDLDYQCGQREMVSLSPCGRGWGEGTT